MAIKVPQRIVVVGGVAGGMSAATRARRLCESCSITVFEKGPYVSYANCGIPYALGGVIQDDASLLLNTPESFKGRFNINVFTMSEVTAIDRASKNLTVKSLGSEGSQSYPYDKLILAQGAESFRLPIEGANLPQVFTLQTIDDLQNIRKYITEHKCQRAAVIGGGFIGLETAENLQRLGLDVTIIEYLPHVFPPADTEMVEPIHAELRRQNVKLLLNAKAQTISKNEPGDIMTVTTSNGDKVTADIVLMAVGVRARTALAAATGLTLGRNGVKVNKYMQTSDPDIYAVGDMVETEHRVLKAPMNVALAGPANRQGRLAVDHIFGRKLAYRGNVGTSVCKVFDMTIASTGLSVQALRSLGRDPQWVTVHPPDHAGYYPGASPVTLRVIFDPETGKLLGAQAVGKKGVDKRIDVLSTAIQAEMSICDLEHLELAYSPPYGAAKDPVNMAGFVGSNVLRGDVRIVHPQDLKLPLPGWQIVDDRSPAEFARGHLPGAVNVPVNNLRESLGMLDKSKKTLLYCHVGYRGYLGYRILVQNGFDVVNLDGGYKSVSEGGYKALQVLPKLA